jgi:hypothetical protein
MKMNNFEDNIRPPDRVISEQLIQDNRSDFQKQIDEAIYLSMQEINQQCHINNEYEQTLLLNYASETNRRSEIFKEFLFNMNKICKFDKEVREIFNIIKPIIDLYCNQNIETCEFEQETYDKIFNTLKKIRNNKIFLDNLKTIILRETI